MRLPIIVSPDKFALWFNAVVPAYRDITVQDVRDLTKCGLIWRYKYYGLQDIETVRAILQYEQLRDERSQKEDATRKCKRCGQVLPIQTNRTRGRLHEYCNSCEKFRSKERQEKWRMRQVIQI